jgi:hypothetical protein
MRGSLPALDPGRAWQASQELHKFPGLGMLVVCVEETVRTVLRFLHVGYDAFEVTACWANVSAPGASHAVHMHPNNYVGTDHFLALAPTQLPEQIERRLITQREHLPHRQLSRLACKRRSWGMAASEYIGMEARMPRPVAHSASPCADRLILGTVYVLRNAGNQAPPQPIDQRDNALLPATLPPASATVMRLDLLRIGWISYALDLLRISRWTRFSAPSAGRSGGRVRSAPVPGP